jgi:hypothetical protein
LLIAISGRGRLEWNSAAASYGPAEVWLLPASLGAYQIAPESATALLRTYVPDLQEFARQLADQGLDEAAWSPLVHR